LGLDEREKVIQVVTPKRVDDWVRVRFRVRFRVRARVRVRVRVR
jgi:hypothetical protein